MQKDLGIYGGFHAFFHCEFDLCSNGKLLLVFHLATTMHGHCLKKVSWLFMVCTTLDRQTISVIQLPITASTSGSPARNAMALDLFVKPPEQLAMRTGLLVVVEGDTAHPYLKSFQLF